MGTLACGALAATTTAFAHPARASAAPPPYHASTMEPPRMSDLSSLTPMDPLEERRVASELFNLVWSLLDIPDRSPEQEAEMIHAAHASRWHWGRVGRRRGRGW